MEPSIIFPNLGIEIGYFPRGFTIFGFTVTFYALTIVVGVILACIVLLNVAKKTNQDTDPYYDIIIFSTIFAIIGARIYYVIFSWDMYKDNFWSIFNLRNGGVGFYGAFIGGVLAGLVVCKIEKINVLRAYDTCFCGIPLAQCIGRWGNFFNREAYGEYTNGLFAMQIKYSEASGVVTETMKENMVVHNGVEYIQVSPTFLYESFLCLLIFLLILAFRRYHKYNGEIILWYMCGYGLGRFFIEMLRTDSLMIGNSGIRVSQLVSLILFSCSLIILIVNRILIKTGKWTPNFRLVLEDGEPGTKAYNDARKAAKKEKRQKESKWETYEVKPDKKEIPKDEIKEAAPAEEAPVEEVTKPDLPDDIKEAAPEPEAPEAAEPEKSEAPEAGTDASGNTWTEIDDD